MIGIIIEENVYNYGRPLKVIILYMIFSVFFFSKKISPKTWQAGYCETQIKKEQGAIVS